METNNPNSAAEVKCRLLAYTELFRQKSQDRGNLFRNVSNLKNFAQLFIMHQFSSYQKQDALKTVMPLSPLGQVIVTYCTITSALGDQAEISVSPEHSSLYAEYAV